MKRRRFIHCSLKKKARNGAVLNGTMGLLLPLDARGRGRRRSSLPLSLSLLKLKKTPTQSPHLPKLWPVAYHDVEKTEGTCPFGGFWGGCTVAALASLSPIFPINIGKIVEKKKERGRSRTEEGRSWRSKEKRREKQRKKRKKNCREAEERRRRIAAWSHRHFATNITANDSSHCRSAPPSSSTSLFFFYVFFSTVHVVCEQWRGPLFKGSGSAQFKKKLKKFLLKKNCYISVYFLIKFCLILVGIFIP